MLSLKFYGDLLPYTLKTQVKQTHVEFEPNPFHYLAVECNLLQQQIRKELGVMITSA